ncbi:MAG: sulfatase-like hydrolase/transferase, partial [Opitutales bacterium]|nr:sulfatase-like hydrolase/transferase [Opitutales bacterium]
MKHPHTFPTRLNVLRLLPAIAIAIIGLHSLCQAASVDGSRPNIVFMLADDMGWNEVGFNGGNPELTPNMDRLRADGLKLTQFYSH